MIGIGSIRGAACRGAVALGLWAGAGPGAWGEARAHAPSVEIQVNLTADTGDDYVTWSATPCRARLTAPAAADLAVTLANAPTSPAGAGEVKFAASPAMPWPANTTATAPTLALTLPGSGAWINFAVAGWPGRASTGTLPSPDTSGLDTAIIAHSGDANGPVVGRAAVMVRVRKNANGLTPAERDRFIAALARLNQQGGYQIYQSIHKAGYFDAHEGPAFFPWHRAFVLQLERSLQAIDPRVALPYWKFDELAPNVFAAEFMGADDGTLDGTLGFQRVRFSSGHPFLQWQVDGLRILRGAIDHRALPSVQGDPSTLAVDPYINFQDSEGSPHGDAHTWTDGWMGNPTIAVRDPLFFLLHCNVDRLWAEWQQEHKHYGTDAGAYVPQGPFGTAGPNTPRRRGHYLQDSMWPWNGGTRSLVNGMTFNLVGQPLTTLPNLGPPASPTVADMIDYQGRAKPGVARQGFDYDTTPF